MGSIFAGGRRCIVAAVLLVQAVHLAAASRSAASFQDEIASLVQSSPDLMKGRIGYEFVDADSGEVLAQNGAGQYFTPASNTKLYTTALALVRLGVTYKFKTVVRTSAALAPHATAVPDLTIVGGGDPNLSGRPLPYTPEIWGQTPPDPLTAIHKLADQIVQKGIERVDGDVTGDDTRYPYDPYPDGWTVDDGIWYYGAPVSALCLNDSSVHVTVNRTTPGELADIQLDPDFGHFILLNQVLTSEDGTTRISMTRPAGSNELLVSGVIGKNAPKHEEDIAVVDPALFAAQALKDELERRGISVHGEARALHSDLSLVPNPQQQPRLVTIATGTDLAQLESAPLAQAVQVVNKVSQNLHAEILLREVGYATRGVGTLAAGLDERKRFLSEAGIPEDSYAFADGSGLARQGLTTPATTVALLRYMWLRPEKQALLDSLPIGGVDGSLKKRFRGIEGAERVHGKTGSLSHVAALSGYLQMSNGKWIIFALMANAEIEHSKNVLEFFDKACGLFLRE